MAGMDHLAPLSGLRVADFSVAMPGPFLTRCLVDLGAEVTKVEPTGGDIAERFIPGTYNVLTHGKAVRRVDLKTKVGLDFAMSLVRAADILVEGFRPGVMDRLGLGYGAVSAVNPRIVYVSISGFGQEGPLSDVPGHDINYLASSGFLALCGDPALEPREGTGAPVGDLAGAMYALASTMAALLQRGSEGHGQHLDVSITDCLMHWMNTRLGQFQLEGLRTISECRASIVASPAYGVFRTADGEWVAIGAFEDKFWYALVDALKIDVSGVQCDSRADRIASAAEINDLIADAVARRSVDNLCADLQAVDVPATHVMAPLAAVASAHARARKLQKVTNDLSYVRFPVQISGCE
jgi:CoA:oxalate CoA-transferase